MKIHCPGCGVSGSVSDSYTGRKIRCPKCQEVFRCRAADESVINDKKDGSGRQDKADVLPKGTDAAHQARDAEQPPGQIPADTGHEKSRQSTPLPVCTLCGKAAGGGEKYTELAGHLYCSDCTPAQEELEAPLLDSSSTGESPIDIQKVPEPPLPEDVEGATLESFTIGGVISRSWELTHGAKGQIWVGMLVMIGVLLGFEAAARFAGKVLGLNIFDIESGSFASLLYECVSSGISTIITAGIMYMGVKWVRERQIHWRDAFSGFSTVLSILIAMVLQFVLLTIGFFLLILPGIYLTVGYSMTMPLIIDRRMSPWEAMEASRRGVHKIWWKMFGLMLIMMLIMSISAIPFGIGLIWTVPMAFILSGLVYTYLFPESEKS